MLVSSTATNSDMLPFPGFIPAPVGNQIRWPGLSTSPATTSPTP